MGKNKKECFKVTKAEPEDYYYVGSKMVMKESYHLKRGFCCGNKCTNCPYGK